MNTPTQPPSQQRSTAPEQVSDQAPEQQPVLPLILERARTARTILIDGQSGAGKTTLAQWLSARLNRPTIHLDDYYPGWGGLSEASRITAKDVLKPHNPGYHRWDWESEQRGPWQEVPAGEKIIEGCGALTDDTLTAAQALGEVFSIAVTGETDTRKHRALTRDPDYSPHWDMWAAQEQHHHTTRPAADITIDGTALPLLVLSAVALQDTQGRFVHVRKQNSQGWILPGGKRELGETPTDTAVRELREELGLTLEPSDLALAGVFAAPAANEAATEVVCHIFTHPTGVEELPAPRAEIAAVEAFHPTDEVEHLAPLSRLFFDALTTPTSSTVDGTH